MGDSGKDKGKGLTERTQKSSKEAGNWEKSEQGQRWETIKKQHECGEKPSKTLYGLGSI